ncbi:DUF1801 domain-containing protein [Flagellimonas sediminis]|uniref:DUF1801 domain-containing protein n=1 Tax=Flagellimonas sediminis TaxID=2696468 RepID=A0A6I5KSY2_9FLAO|nr:DUF1801 domain-containing protein [Allomuricauda sediminis]NDV42779.1 DUF1801 domain-containing protein [Allomuricauda sediminis]
MNKNQDVTTFLDQQNHPLRTEIEQLRELLLKAEPKLHENVKWNGPNYCIGDADRITMKIQPPKQIQLIFHRGVKKLEQPKQRLLTSSSKLLLWKENDRSVASFKNQNEIENSASELRDIIKDWIKVTME